MNQARTTVLKSLLTNDINSNPQNLDTKKLEEQILNLSKKIEKLQNKNNELSAELLEKDKILENEKNKSINLVNEYEKRLQSANEEHNTIIIICKISMYSMNKKVICHLFL